MAVSCSRISFCWQTVVAEVKTLPAFSRIGYDWTETVEQKTKIAVLPVGYWHGYDRSLSGQGYAIIKGTKVRVLGRVSMDMIVVDVSAIPEIKVGAIATLIGQDGSVEVKATELGKLAGTSNYEIVTRLNHLIKRLYK